MNGRRLGIVAVAAAGLALACAQGAAAATTLVTTARPIVGLAYDGSYLAWDTRPDRCTFGNE